MREIKLKAFIKELGEIHDVTSLNFVDGEVFHIYLQSTEEVYYAYKNEFELIRYTGLKDVNGREIYEGDVVKILYCESPLLVTYDSGMFLAEFTNGNVHYLGEHYIGCEVLGNFYENPELMEGNQ